MFARAAVRKPVREQGESPFWISFADLMTALMTLFLVVMCVTLLAVTRNVNVEEQRKVQREQGLAQLMLHLQHASRPWPGVRVDALAQRIDLGELVRFESGRYEISPAGAQFLRAYIPVVLHTHRGELGQRWIRRVVIEGFADQDGDYLYNLALSLNRSKEVVCALYRAPGVSERPLTDEERRQIRDLFLVGGYSFNASKASKQASRRVELKVEFWQLDETPDAAPVASDKGFGRC